MSQDFHMCNVVVDWEDGMSTEYIDERKCTNEATGEYTFETEAGMEVTEWLCEDHREMYVE